LRHKIVRNNKINDDALIQKLGVIEAGLYEPSHENYLIGVEVQSLQMTNLRELIASLPRRQQEAINLRYYHNFSNEEIARIMGVNYQSACKFIYSALKSLKVNLQISVTSWLMPIFFLASMD
jgi:RNA polymerase sigma factor (sigma-70 family)